MTLEQTPAPARSDVRRPAPAATTPPTRRPYFKQGTLLTAGALAWAASMMVVGGSSPSEETWELVAFGLGSGLFQLGVMGLLTVLWRTRALGDGRLARFFLRLEAVLLSFAIASTTVDTLGISDLDQAGWLILDLFWPLSMMGMFFIGIRIAIAGKWKGVARFWPLVAESWAVVTVPTFNIFGSTAAGVVGALHLVIGYAVLGQIVARKVD